MIWTGTTVRRSKKHFTFSETALLLTYQYAIGYKDQLDYNSPLYFSKEENFSLLGYPEGKIAHYFRFRLFLDNYF